MAAFLNWENIMPLGAVSGPRVVLVTLVTAVVATACSTQGTTMPTSAAPSAAISSSAQQPHTPAETAKEQAITAYLGMWHDMAEAATTSDWQSSKLAQNATGEALLTISRGLYADHNNGFITKGAPVNHPEFVSSEPADLPTKIVLKDCGDSTNWLKYHMSNGVPVDDGPSGRRHIDAIVKKAVDGTWKVTEFAVREVGSCTG